MQNYDWIKKLKFGDLVYVVFEPQYFVFPGTVVSVKKTMVSIKTPLKLLTESNLFNRYYFDLNGAILHSEKKDKRSQTGAKLFQNSPERENSFLQYKKLFKQVQQKKQELKDAKNALCDFTFV